MKKMGVSQNKVGFFSAKNQKQTKTITMKRILSHLKSDY